MVFEDYFSELQADMVSICLEYVQGQADKIYIYTCFEPRIRSCGCFFVINGKLLQRHKITQELPECDIELQEQVDEVIMEDLYKLNNDVCTQFNQPMPTEIKMVYDVKNNSLSANYQYDLIIQASDTLVPQLVEEAWFEEIKQQMVNN